MLIHIRVFSVERLFVTQCFGPEKTCSGDEVRRAEALPRRYLGRHSCTSHATSRCYRAVSAFYMVESIQEFSPRLQFEDPVASCPALSGEDENADTQNRHLYSPYQPRRFAAVFVCVKFGSPSPMVDFAL